MIYIIRKKHIFNIIFIIFVLICLSVGGVKLINNINVGTFNKYDSVIYRGPIDEKLISLTFDDGPHPRLTPKLLDLLKEYDAKATFFVIGKNVECYPDVLKRVYEDGHEIGNHSYSHIDIKKSSLEDLKEEFFKTQNLIFDLTGKEPILFRPPFGYLNKNTINFINENGCTTVLWTPSQDSMDWNHPASSKIVKAVLSDIENGDIILFHDYIDGRWETYDALKVILPELKNQGFKFVTVSELLDELVVETKQAKQPIN